MGQSVSSYFPKIRQPQTGSSPSLVIHLPIDILLLVINQLHETPECVFALDLTCKTLYALLISQAPALEPLALDSLLRLLEKDAQVGSQFYFCPVCCKLHRFSPSCGPLTNEHTIYNRECRYLRSCYADTSFCLETGKYTLGYHHARLVLNRHLNGAPCGLPLHNLTAASVHGLVVPNWSQNWSARVIDSELFLCVTHTIHSYGMSDLLFRSIIDRDHAYFICRHADLSSDIPALKIPRASSCETRTVFSECRELVGACNLCLTDHCTTIKWKGTPKKTLLGIRNRLRPVSTGWIITIVAYHQFGSCRFPYDWKWRAITGSTRPTLGNWRDDNRYPPGSIRDKWLLSLS